MKFKFNENSKRVLRKLHNEGLLANFIKSIADKIEDLNDKEIDKVLKKGNQQAREFAKFAKQNPDAALKQVLSDIGAE